MTRLVVELPPGEYLLRGPIRIYDKDVVVEGAAVRADQDDVVDAIDKRPGNEDPPTGATE